MKIIKKMRKAKGFTLVELLIVIIIIGILAGMMMLATGAATDKAEATKIVSNLRNIKAAVIMAYADGSAWPTSAASADMITKYLDQKELFSKGYSVLVTSADSVATVEFNASGLSTGIQGKLNEMAATEVISMDGTTAIMSIN